MQELGKTRGSLCGATEYFFIQYALKHQPREGGVLKPDFSHETRGNMEACARVLGSAREKLDELMSNSVAKKVRMFSFRTGH